MSLSIRCCATSMKIIIPTSNWRWNDIDDNNNHFKIRFEVETGFFRKQEILFHLNLVSFCYFDQRWRQNDVIDADSRSIRRTVSRWDYLWSPPTKGKSFKNCKRFRGGEERLKLWYCQKRAHFAMIVRGVPSWGRGGASVQHYSRRSSVPAPILCTPSLVNLLFYCPHLEWWELADIVSIKVWTALAASMRGS